MIKTVTKSLSKKPSKNLELELTIPLSTLKQQQQCNNIANYFSNYLTASYTHHKQRSFYTYSTIFFELIENAMRFSQKDNDSISIDLKKKNNNISILVTNYTNNYHANRFQHCLTKIKKESTLERLLLHCIQNQETKSTAQCGLIQLACNFNVTFSAKITPISSTRSKIEMLALVKDT